MNIEMRKMISTSLIALIIATSFSCKGDDENPVSLSASPSKIEFEVEGGTATLTIKSNAAWTVINTSEWVSESISESEGDAYVELTAEENETGIERSTIISVISAELVEDIEVSQKGIYDFPPDDTEMRDLTSIELAALMGVGWNAGNSLEAIGGETKWGNPLLSQTLFDSVKAAGFNAIRVPVAWSKFSNENSFTIDFEWMNRVEEVVNYILNSGMYAIVNIHWDEGWMQPTYDQEEYVNGRLEVMWQQIATHFRDYNDYLLFAGTNEVHVTDNYGTPSKENYTVQNGFNQTFVTAVRETGGRNAYRHLVVQGYNTNIDNTVNFATIPTDFLANRLMMEVHYYDPYNFTLNENSSISQWGKNATDPALTETWANESYVDAQFQKMKSNFIDKGVAVILGEYGAITRTSVPGHEDYRAYYNEYITQSAVDHGLVPFYWDNGYTGDKAFGIFNRATGGQVHTHIIDAIVSAVE